MDKSSAHFLLAQASNLVIFFCVFMRYIFPNWSNCPVFRSKHFHPPFFSCPMTSPVKQEDGNFTRMNINRLIARKYMATLVLTLAESIKGFFTWLSLNCSNFGRRHKEGNFVIFRGWIVRFQTLVPFVAFRFIFALLETCPWCGRVTRTCLHPFIWLD